MARSNASLNPMSSVTPEHKGGTRGVASVEAAVALPFFLLVLAGLFFVHGVTIKKHELSISVRACAWLYSQTNCQLIPPGCNEVLGPPGVTVTKPSLKLHDELKGTARQAAALTGIISNIVIRLLSPFLDAAFGESFDATSRGSVNKPALYGGGIVSISAQYHLACNLAEEEPLDVVSDAWNMFRP